MGSREDSTTRILIEHLHRTRFEDLPSPVIEQTKNCVEDFIGTALGGLSTEFGRLAKNYVALFGRSDESTVVATRDKSGALEAAFCNGLVGHALELEDGNRFAMGHPGVVTIPAALAAAEKASADGKRLILGIVCGYEVFGRLGKAMNPSHFKRGFHTTATLGTMAAATAAAKVLRLTHEQMLNAFGIAGSFSAGLSEFIADGSTTKQIHAGRAAQNGVFASVLAQNGFTGPHTVLEGAHGFLRAYADSYSATKMIEGLGTDYEISKTYYKRHASCRYNHAALDATFEILARESIAPETIDEVHIQTYSAAYDYTNVWTTETPLSAKMSLPYCIAVAILRGKVGPEEFTEDTIRDRQILQLMKKVKMSVDKEIDKLVPEKRPAIVRISTAGRQISERVDLPKGEPENPLSRTEFEEKFRSLASTALTPSATRRMLEVICDLENLSKIDDLTRLLRRPR